MYRVTANLCAELKNVTFNYIGVGSKELLEWAPKSYWSGLQRAIGVGSKELWQDLLRKTHSFTQEYDHFWEPLFHFLKRAFVFKISDRPSNFENLFKSKRFCKVKSFRVDCAIAHLQPISGAKVVSKVLSRPHKKSLD